MQLTDDAGHRALAYIDAVSRQGYTMTVDEFNAYMKAPRQVVRSGLVAMVGALQKSLASLQLTTEDLVDWLERVYWIEVDGDYVLITSLGRAVLAATEEAERVDELPVDIILDPDDELSYARLIGTIAEAGDAALVDSYFGADQLFAIKQRTRVTRILVDVARLGTRRSAELQQALDDMRFDRVLEVRSSSEFHDRFVIPTHGGVRMLGASLNGVGNRFSVTTSLEDGLASNAIRSAFERAWNAAELVGLASQAVKEEDGGTSSETATVAAQLSGTDEVSATEHATVTRQDDGEPPAP